MCLRLEIICPGCSSIVVRTQTQVLTHPLGLSATGLRCVRLRLRRRYMCRTELASHNCVKPGCRFNRRHIAANPSARPARAPVGTPQAARAAAASAAHAARRTLRPMGPPPPYSAR